LGDCNSTNFQTRGPKIQHLVLLFPVLGEGNVHLILTRSFYMNSFEKSLSEKFIALLCKCFRLWQRMVSFKLLRNICVINDQGYVPLVVNILSHSWLIAGFVTRVTRWVPLVEQELLTLPGQLSSPPGLNGVRVTRSLILFVCFVERCLSFCPFSFSHCVVCPSSIYGFWLFVNFLILMHFYCIAKWSSLWVIFYFKKGY